MWRVIIGKLYIADHASDYLQSFNGWGNNSNISQQQAIDTYASCKLCGHPSPDIAHCLFECPHQGMIDYWNDINELHDSINMRGCVPTQWGGWLDDIEKDDNKDIKGVFKQEITWNALYAVWINYIELIQQYQKNLVRTGWTPDTYSDTIRLWRNSCYNTYVHLISKRILLIPTQLRAIEYSHTSNYGIDQVRRGEQHKNKEIAPPLDLMKKTIDQHLQDAYNLTWCRNNIIAEIVNDEIIILIHGRPPDPAMGQ